LHAAFSAQAQSVSHNLYNASDKDLVNKLLQLTYNCQIKEAKALVDQVLQKDSLSIEWNYFRGMILLRSMSDNQSNKDEIEQFDKAINKVLTIGEERLAQNPNDSIGLFYTGAAYGYLAICHIKKGGSTFKSAFIAKKGLEMHKKLISLFPDYYDAYLSLGIFNYYASDVPLYLKPIVFILGMSGDKEKGIEYLTLVSDKGTLAIYEAREMLAVLYLIKGELEQAAILYKLLAMQFRCNYKYANSATGLLQATKHYTDVIEIGKNIWKLYHAHTGGLTKSDSLNINNICSYLGEAYSELGQSKEAIEIFEKMIEENILVQRHDHFFLLLGRNYEKEHNNVNSVRCYRKVMELTNTDTSRKEAQERIIFLTKNK
jgi:pentatricopeptide repeat protein